MASRCDVQWPCADQCVEDFASECPTVRFSAAATLSLLLLQRSVRAWFLARGGSLNNMDAGPPQPFPINTQVDAQ